MIFKVFISYYKYKKIGNDLPSIASDFNKPSYNDGSNQLPINIV